MKDFLTGPSVANTVPVGFALSLANHQITSLFLKSAPKDYTLIFATNPILRPNTKVPQPKSTIWLHWLTRPIRTYHLTLAQAFPLLPKKHLISLSNANVTPLIPHLPLQGNKSPWSQEFGVWVCSVPTLRPPYRMEVLITHFCQFVVLLFVCLPISESFLDFFYLSIFVLLSLSGRHKAMLSTAPHKRTERASEISRSQIRTGHRFSLDVQLRWV